MIDFYIVLCTSISFLLLSQKARIAGFKGDVLWFIISEVSIQCKMALLLSVPCRAELLGESKIDQSCPSVRPGAKFRGKGSGHGFFKACKSLMTQFPPWGLTSQTSNYLSIIWEVGIPTVHILWEHLRLKIIHNVAVFKSCLLNIPFSTMCVYVCVYIFFLSLLTCFHFSQSQWIMYA